MLHAHMACQACLSAGSQRLIVNPTRSEVSSCSTRQPEGTDSCFDVLVVGKLFFVCSFFPTYLAKLKDSSVH